jgi:ubiquitin-like modifier-activating enzyme ATG7
MTLQFEPWSSAVDATFWFELSRKKLNELRLDDSSLSVKGYYVPGFLIKNGMTSPSRLFVTSESFYSEPS